MSVDLSKLTPAPWDAKNWRVCAFPPPPIGVQVICDTANNKASRNAENDANAAFIALARNAFDVMMRRGWSVVPNYTARPGTFWRVRLWDRDHKIEEQEFPDPFTALVEADAWYAANVEAAPAASE